MFSCNQLFKQGESVDLNNYRPISIIPVVAKVFERIVYNQFYIYLTEHNFISSKQSGFQSLHSDATALLEAVDSRTFYTDKSNVNGVVFLDLKKAFDTVDHSILYLNYIAMVLEILLTTGLNPFSIFGEKNVL